MSDQAQSNNQQVIVYALVAIAVLLAAIVGFMIYNNVHNAVPAPTASSTGSDTSGANIAAQMPKASGPVSFDPKTATKLPAGMTPEAAISAYSDAVMAGKWATAYALLPLAARNTYGTPDAMGSQLKSYGITGFKAGKAASSGTDVSIALQEITPMMPVTYTWTFTKAGDTWYVKDRTSGGSVQ